MSALTPQSFLEWLGVASAALAVIIKGGTWLFGEMARRAAERRKDQDQRIAELEEWCEAEKRRRMDLELAYETRISALNTKIRELETARDEARRDVARMEGLLYRMGYDKTDAGWVREAHPPPRRTTPPPMPSPEDQ